MAYSATLANLRGLLSSPDHARLLRLFSRAGLSMDHPQFDPAILEKATSAILRTRDGKLRAAVPVSPMGDCVFLNDVTHEEMCKALEVHKGLMAQFARAGAGIDAYVDASDTGEVAEAVQEKEVGSASNGHYTTTSGSAYQPANGVPAMHAGGDLPRVVDNLKGSMDQSARGNNVIAVADGGLQ